MVNIHGCDCPRARRARACAEMWGLAIEESTKTTSLTSRVMLHGKRKSWTHCNGRTTRRQTRTAGIWTSSGLWKLPLRGCWKMFSRSLNTYKINLKGWVLSLNQDFFKNGSLSDVDSWGLLLLALQDNAAKVWRLIKRLAETQRSLVSHIKKRPKYADSGNYFLNERNSCSRIHTRQRIYNIHLVWIIAFILVVLIRNIHHCPGTLNSYTKEHWPWCDLNT